MSTGPSYGGEYNYEAAQAQLQRRRALAQALMQGGQMPQGQMVGNRFVAPSPWQQLAAVGSQLAGAYMDRNTNKREASIKQQERQRLAEVIRQLGLPGGQPPGEGPTAQLPRDPGMSMPAAAQGAPSIQSPPGPALQGMPASPPASMGPPATTPGQPPVDPRREAALAVLRDLPIEAQQQIVGQQAMGSLFPKPEEDFTLKPGEARFRGGKQVANMAAEPDKAPSAVLEYEQAKKDGFKGSFFDYQLALKKAGGTSISNVVNTEKGLYGGMASKQGDANVELYTQAQKAPDLLQRAQRVKQLLGPNTQAITGAGAEWLLTGSKIANQLGFNTGDAASDTEALSRELAASTLDSIKSSGLGGGTGFSNADRDFLEKAVGGKITLEAKTLKRLADLNEKASLTTIQRWNATASRLKPEELKALGMAQIEMPAGTQPPGAKPKLIQNPDGSYTYSP